MNATELHYKKMTETPVARLVIRLGIPTTISMLITSIYNMADTYFVGTIGIVDAQGSIGILFTLQAIIQAVAFMLGHGSGTFVSKELANKDVKKATTYVSSAFFVGGAIGLVFTAVGLLLLEPFMRLLGATEAILPYAKDYGMWVLISCPFMICSLILNNNLRYEGKATYAMIGLVSGAFLNMGMDYVFIEHCGLQVFGAGMATALSQIISFVILLAMYLTKAQSTISIKAVSKDIKLYLGVFRAGFPSLIRQGLTSISGAILNNLAGFYGGQISEEMASAAIDAMTIVNRLANFVMCVGLGISQGLQPVAAFNYQARKYARVKKSLTVTCLIGFGIIVILAVPLIAAPRFFIRVFQDSAEVLDFGAPALVYAMIGQLFVPLFTPLNMMYQSIRKSGMASFLALLRSGLLFIPTLFITTAITKLTGIQISQPISDILTGLVALPILIHFYKTTPSIDEPDEDMSEQTSTAIQDQPAK